ncbi:GNAT family N-acetyltransferase [Shewanella sp. AS16]|uniref:GNAT family N-acetyltransferase n=1 Tax=Shewanella sp. AS16 TaxID=2907625 RepID=UPI001F414171|nr:GNAT family N-acetyltransferase [Shewanella sp. AS16]MCE9685544.1 GNAT family N-acetyltransferase [Shewanella sp. AS16]
MRKLNLPDGLHIRPSRPSDRPFLEQLHHATREDLQLIQGEKELIESVIEMQFKAQNQGYGDQFPNAMYFIIEKHHEAIGKATLDFGHNEIRLLDIAFLPQARRHGFGKAIIQSFQMAATQACAPLSLTVLKDNLAAQRLYLSLGFRVDSFQEPYYFMAWYPPTQRVMSAG